MERQRLPYNIGLKAPFNVWLQVGCCPNSPPIVSKIVGILKDNDPLFPLCMLSNHCKVLPTPMYSPMKRLYRGIVVSTAGIFLEYSVEFLVVVPIEWMYVGETERLIPWMDPLTAECGWFIRRGGCGTTTVALSWRRYSMVDFLSPSTWPALTVIESFHFKTVVFFPSLVTSGIDWLAFFFVALSWISKLSNTA